MYDAIVVGARCAGSTVARVLASAGRRVLLVDKTTFPSDTLSTLYLQPVAMKVLDDAGLLPAVAATGAPPIRMWNIDLDGAALTSFPWSPESYDHAYAPRRLRLDEILVDAAVAAGCELRERFIFEDVIRDGDRVVGIRGRTSGGDTVEERARIVIGADGLRSHVAKKVGAPVVVEKPSTGFGYYSFYEGVPQETLEYRLFGERGDRRVVILIPTSGATLVWGAWQPEHFERVRSDLEARFLANADDAGVGARVRAGRRLERFVGMSELPNFMRQTHGPGWALVGDAAYHKDPHTAQGISDALYYGRKLGEGIASVLDDRAALDDALAAHQRHFIERSTPIFDWTVRFGELRPTSDKTRWLLAALAKVPDEAARFLGLNACTVTQNEFFAPEHLAGIFERASAQ